MRSNYIDKKIIDEIDSEDKKLFLNGFGFGVITTLIVMSMILILTWI